MSPAPDPLATPDSAASTRRRGALLVACAAVCWSSGGLIARLVGTGPWTTNLWRSLFASLFLAVVLGIVRRRSILAQWREGGRPVVAVAVCMSLASTCFIFSLTYTSVANTLILMSTGPYVAGLLGWILLGERVASRTWLTMGVALAGAVVMVSSSWGRGAILGDLLAIAMAASFAVATVLIRRHPEIRMGRRPRCRPRSRRWWRCRWPSRSRPRRATWRSWRSSAWDSSVPASCCSWPAPA
jgi:drug/metabolite transporter (DMT)-like permease